MKDNGNLLHNMSSPPSSVVRYTGLSTLVRSGGPRARKEQAGVFGKSIRFVFAPGPSGVEVRGILEDIGVKPDFDPERQLSALIDDRARQLPLPDGCVVVPVLSTHRVVWSDTLSALAILAKCSAAVWLRAKTPSVRAALKRRDVSLLIPPAFAVGLPEDGS